MSVDPDIRTVDYERVVSFVVDGICGRCGGEVECWTEWVPCCGPPHECEDPLYCKACHACGVMSSDF